MVKSNKAAGADHTPATTGPWPCGPPAMLLHAQLLLHQPQPLAARQVSQVGASRQGSTHCPGCSAQASAGQSPKAGAAPSRPCGPTAMQALLASHQPQPGKAAQAKQVVVVLHVCSSVPGPRLGREEVAPACRK